MSLPPEHNSGGFDCGEPDMNSYLQDGDAHRDIGASVSRTYLVMHGEHLVGYFSVLLDAIRLQGKERPAGIPYGTAPALKLGRMAVCLTHRRKQVGEWILDYVIGVARELSSRVGCRYVTLDALQRPKLIAWYKSNGFVSNEAERDARKIWRFAKRTVGMDVELPQVSMRYDVLLQEELRAGK